LVNYSFSSEDLRRLVAAIERYYKPAIQNLIENLHPARGLSWEEDHIASLFSQTRNEYVKCTFCLARSAEPAEGSNSTGCSYRPAILATQLSETFWSMYYSSSPLRKSKSNAHFALSSIGFLSQRALMRIQEIYFCSLVLLSANLNPPYPQRTWRTYGSMFSCSHR
jgi:hypothetical protein